MKHKDIPLYCSSVWATWFQTFLQCKLCGYWCAVLFLFYIKNCWLWQDGLYVQNSVRQHVDQEYWHLSMQDEVLASRMVETSSCDAHFAGFLYHVQLAAALTCNANSTYNNIPKQAGLLAVVQLKYMTSNHWGVLQRPASGSWWHVYPVIRLQCKVNCFC